MSYIKLECKKDFLSFKKGEIFEFNQSTIIIGTNGSGKTTLLSAIRAALSNKEADGFWDQNFSKYEKTLEHFTVDTDFISENSVFCFGREDSGEAQTYDAYSMIMGGGYAVQKRSRGESALITINRKLGSDKEKLKNNLLVFDEVDCGLDIKNQALFSKNLIPNLLKLNTFILLTSHSYITISYINLPIYLLDKRKFINLQEFDEFLRNE